MSTDAARVAEIAAAWTVALAEAAHPAGCLCAGRFRWSADARVVEDTILEDLHAAYHRSGRPLLCAVVEGRRAQLLSDGKAGPFEGWLASILHLPETDRATLLTDLARLVESIRPASGQGFICS